MSILKKTKTTFTADDLTSDLIIPFAELQNYYKHTIRPKVRIGISADADISFRFTRHLVNGNAYEPMSDVITITANEEYSIYMDEFAVRDIKVSIVDRGNADVVKVAVESLS